MTDPRIADPHSAGTIRLLELKDLAIEFGVGDELFKILAVEFVEQLLRILRIEPEDLVGSCTSQRLKDLTPVSVILDLDNHPILGVEGRLPHTALRLYADIDQFAGHRHVGSCGSSVFGNRRIPAFRIEIVGKGLCRGIAESAAREAEVTLPSPEMLPGAEL